MAGESMTQDWHSAIYRGWVRHRRYWPAAHDFRYRLYHVYLDLAELPRLFEGRWLWSLERANLASFRRRDFLGDPAEPLLESVHRCVQSQCGDRLTGPVRLLTHLRYFGLSFNPVSFYYCFDASGRELTHIVAEITNTPWGERHQYVLPIAAGQVHGRSWHFAFDKRFHVSPFLPMDRQYDWRFDQPGDDLHVHMNVNDGQRRQFDATLVLQRRPWSGAALATVLARHPLMTLKVMRAIYWQAFLIRCKRNPFYAHP
ncbi:MAG: DUF1365 domain-containing protein [Xanthomonadales bacterium]|nr:DUF1365 domain-containing protein [Xanthomonadales bacterium]MCB1642539.1 DUF1365 domain-containing protein [Xanthomonadales bacterium]